MPESRPPHPVDIHVGLRLRLRRVAHGLSQEALGARVGVSLQQIQKYERGQTRISASRLFDLAAALEVPVDDFFRNLPQDCAAPPPQAAPPEPWQEPATAAETRAVVRAFWHLPDAGRRRQVLDLLNALGRRR